MPSSCTQNYSLNQWEADDQVVRADFNADNAKIDAAIKAVDQRVDSLSASKADVSALSALTQTVNTKADASALSALQTAVNGKAAQSALTALQTVVNGKADKTALAAVEAKVSRIITGTYTGTGGTEGVRHITLPGRPKMVLIRTEYPGTSHHYRAVVMTDIAVFCYYTYGVIDIQALGNGYELKDNGFTVPNNCDQNYLNAPQHYLAVI